MPEGIRQPPQADSAQQQQGVQQWQISAGHSSKHFPPRQGYTGNVESYYKPCDHEVG